MNVSRSERILIDKYKGIYFSIPKVACSSIKQSISESLDLNIPKNLIHKEIPKFSGPIPLDFKSYFKFSFVRNPYDRLLSCYKSKIKPEKAGITTKWLVDGVNRGIHKMHGDLFWGKMTFADFCFSVSKIPDLKSNEHFRSQHTFIYEGDKCEVDFIGKFENLEADYNYVSKALNSNMKLGHFGNQTKHNKFQEYYDKDLKEIVFKRYRTDFELFNYGK